MMRQKSVGCVRRFVMHRTVEPLTEHQLKAELKRTWQRYSDVKEKMAPLLYELRKKLRKPGSRKGEGWAAWIEAGHIGICVRTANRWADEHAGKSTSRPKSQGPRGAALPGEERTYPFSFVVTEAEEEQIHEAVKVLGAEEVRRIVIETLLKAAERKKNETHSLAAHP